MELGELSEPHNCMGRRQGEGNENDSGGKGSGEDMRKILKTFGF